MPKRTVFNCEVCGATAISYASSPKCCSATCGIIRSHKIKLISRKITVKWDVAKIPLTRGKYALIDARDIPIVSKYLWYAVKGKNTFYAHSGGDTQRPKTSMHRLLLGIKNKDRVCDHIDGDGLNNRRYNLRECSPLQNHYNSRGRKIRRSKYKGVKISNNKKGWIAYINGTNEPAYLGTFDTEKDAAIAYDNAAKKHFGEFAWLNFPKLKNKSTPIKRSKIRRNR